MMAATRSSPECSASDSTPKLPVRSTRKVLSETSASAEPTLSSAARFFSFTSSTTRAVITTRLDYRSPRPFAHGHGGRGDVKVKTSALELAANRNAVAQRNQNREQLFRRIYQPVELLHAARIPIFGSRGSRCFAGPQGVVRHKQSSALQLRQCCAQRVRILVLVYVVENEIKLSGRLLHQLQRVAHLHVDALGHSRSPEMLLCSPRVFRIAIRIENFRLRSRRARQPNR